MTTTLLTRTHSFQADSLASLDAVALAEKIRRGDISVGEATEAAIARAEQVNPLINAIALRTYEQARAQARRQTSVATLGHGAFAGVPTFIKDNVDLAGHPTQQGTRVFKAKLAPRDDPFVTQMLAQGFNVIGKSTLPEFAFNGSTESQDGSATANPWHTAYSAGGSSGGAAALVAAGVVPLAHGNDGGGSIRIPAAACGLVGLKTSRRRFVNSDASKSLPLNLISEGVLTRTVRDTAVFLAEAEKTFHNRRYPLVGLVQGPSAIRRRIGLQLLGPNDALPDPESHEAVMRTARLLESCGHTIVPIQARLEQRHIDAFLLYWGFLSFGVHRFGRLLFRATDWDMSHYEGLSLALMKSFEKRWFRIPSAMMALHQTSQLNQRLFAPFDAVLSPVVAHTSPPLGHLSPTVEPDLLLQRLMGYVGFTPLQNVLGTPAVALPAGMSHNDSRPIGIQLSAQAGQEATLLSLAYEIEAMAPFPKIELSA